MSAVQPGAEDVAGNPRGEAVTGITIGRISGGRIVETWTNFDVMGMLTQLGVIPSPGQQPQPGGTLTSGQEPTY